MRTAGSSVDLPTRELGGIALEVVASAAVVLVVLAGLWPPEYVYWTVLSDAVGETATLAMVAVLAVGLGAWVGRTAGFGVATLSLGSAVAFGVGMGAIEVVLEPDSPTHLVWYGALTVCIVGGAVVWAVLERYRSGA